MTERFHCLTKVGTGSPAQTPILLCNDPDHLQLSRALEEKAQADQRASDAERVARQRKASQQAKALAGFAITEEEEEPQVCSLFLYHDVLLVCVCVCVCECHTVVVGWMLDVRVCALGCVLG